MIYIGIQRETMICRNWKKSDLALHTSTRLSRWMLCPQGYIAANMRFPVYIHIFNTPPRCVPSGEDIGKLAKSDGLCEILVLRVG